MEYITVAALAKKLNVGKSTINRRLNELNLKQSLTVENGTFLLTEEQAEQVTRTILTRTKSKNDPAQNARHTEPLSKTGAGTVAALLAQLEEKDRQIAEKDKQINDLHELLARQQATIEASQNLLLLEQKKEEAQKIGFFKRLFNRTDNKKGSQAETGKDEGQETTKP